MRKLTKGLLIVAAILIPLAMIAGAVKSISNHTEAQIITEPTAKLSAKDVTSKSVGIDITVERSQYVFLSEYNGDIDSGKRYYYGESYRVVLIDWAGYEKADAEAKKKNEGSTISIASYVDKDFVIEETSKPIDGSAPKDENNNITFNQIDDYTFTTDTQVQANKTYYELKDKEYVVKELSVGSEIKANTYYEKNITTKFNFKINNLLPYHKYALAVQFYYSVNDAKNTLYNKSYQQRTIFTTAKK